MFHGLFDCLTVHQTDVNIDHDESKREQLRRSHQQRLACWYKPRRIHADLYVADMQIRMFIITIDHHYR